jgi:putative transposase
VMLEREGMSVNHKRLHRLYREEGLVLRKKRRQRASTAARAPLVAPRRAGQRYSRDFMSDSLVLWKQNSLRDVPSCCSFPVCQEKHRLSSYRMTTSVL